MVNCTADDLIRLVTSGSGDFSFSLEGQTYSYHASAKKFVNLNAGAARDALFADSLANLGRDLQPQTGATSGGGEFSRPDFVMTIK